MDRQIQADKAFLEWMVKMSKNVVHIADAWYAAVKWADSHPAWVSVEEELPKEGGEYLVSDGTDSMADIWLCGIGWRDPDNNERVTHWMSKPTPPAPGKEESNERG
jgi:hypothetical protein